MYVKWKNCALTGSPVCPLRLREMSALLPLQAIIDQLEKAPGRPGKPRVTRPLELIQSKFRFESCFHRLLSRLDGRELPAIE